MNCKKEDFLLYAVTDRAWLKPGETMASQVEDAIRGGATFIQLREKHLTGEALRKEALAVQEVCRSYQVPFVINDDVDLALSLHADGVHVGQSDMACADARRRLGPDAIIGVSAHNVEEALQALADGADYLGCGAAFASSSKDDASVISHGTLKAVCEAVPVPVVAIGGISASNIGELAGCHLSGVAVISAIFAKKDIRSAAAKLKDLAGAIV